MRIWKSTIRFKGRKVKMYLNLDEHYKWDDREGSDKDYRFECRLNPTTYHKLLWIMHKNGIVTFDISAAINFAIEHFPD